MYVYALIFLLSRLFVGQVFSTKIYNIKEEIEIGYVVDYVKSNGFKPIRIFNINDTGVDCFNLDTRTGKLSVVKRIDRETLCRSEKLKNYGNSHCEVVIKLAYESFNIVEKLTIVVEDINDNDPKWLKDSVTLKFNENEPIGGRGSLPEATDLDIGQNGQINYRVESRYGNFFRLVQDKGLYIQNIQSLDREKQDFYELVLIANDNGSPSRVSRLKVIIEVNDINDNKPKFTKSVFRPDKLVPENQPIGTVILSLTAEDPDAGRNGKFTFQMNPNTGPEISQYVFVQTTGAVVIRNKIDYDKGHTKFEFKVIVEDDAVHPYSRSSEAVVEIDIQDVNDEYPTVSFYPLHPNRNGRPSIDENLPIMSPIGQLTVKDVDFKGHDKVTCDVLTAENGRPNPVSVITSNDQHEFQVVSNLKFDREVQSEVSCQIQCSDIEKHVTKLNLTISINDVNDHPPSFSKNIFYMYISENQPIGTAVNNRLFVTDIDSGENAEFVLSIDSPDEKWFTIDQKEQLLRSNAVFDRESMAQYKLKILAIDKGTNRLTSTCLVYVLIRDVNDNAVVLSSSVHTFHIQENNKPRTTIGTIKATDLDNQTITYSIDSPIQTKFYVEKYSGNLIIEKSLDREDQDVHYVVIVASDGMHSATATVTVFVDDINDNVPIFTHPNNSNKVIKMDIKETPGYRLDTITATDRDNGENGLVRYTLKKKDQKQLWFTLDLETGDLYLATSLNNPRVPESSIYLDVEACDCGQPKLCTTLSGLEIRWNTQSQQMLNKENVSSMGFSVENFLNEYVLILAIAGLLVFLIIIMVVFVVVKQKSDIFNRRRNPTNLSNVNKSLICYSDNFAPPDYRCSTELENLDNDLRSCSDKRTTPILQCSSLYFTDSKSKMESTPFRCESAPNNISPIFEVQHDSNDMTKRSQNNNDNYYSKYLTDRYCKISNTECPILQIETNNFSKSRNPKNHSSFV